MKYLADPIRSHYFDFRGRVTRKQYWIFFLSILVIGFAVGMIDAFIAYGFIGGLEMGIAYSNPLLSAPFTLAILIPSLAITARRLHDAGRSGWWQILILIPFLGWFVLFAMLSLPSKPANKYGPKPDQNQPGKPQDMVGDAA